MSHDVESLLREALRDARTADRWAVRPVALDAPTVRRAAAARRRRRHAALGALASLVVVVAGTGGLAALAPEPDTLLSGPDQAAPAPAAPGPRSGGAVAGIDPAFVPTSGRDWLLELDALREFEREHVLPSPGPGQRAPSPAPPTDASARLASQATAVLPGGTEVQREDAPGGERGAAALHVRLPDGLRVEVARRSLQAPVSYRHWFSAGPSGVADVPGTTSALTTAGAVGYGWPDGADQARLVAVVDARGTATTWYAQPDVPLALLRTWAVATEQRAAAGR